MITHTHTLPAQATHHTALEQRRSLTRRPCSPFTCECTSVFRKLLRDDLDENGGGDLDFEAAAGSGVMIVADLQLCKFFRRRC